MNHLAGLASLRNSYFEMRHGHSKSNFARILVGSPENAINGYGLTGLGVEQAEQSAKAMAGVLGKGTLIFSSDYARARETAEITMRIVGAKDVVLAPELRERGFGELEKKASPLIHEMWMLDEKNPAHKTFGVESVLELQERVTRYVRSLEREYEGRNILLVSHGDPLQVLQVSAVHIDPAFHNRIPYIKNAEIRSLEFMPSMVFDMNEEAK